MNEEHEVQTRKGVTIRLVFGVAAAVGAWLVLRHWTYVSGEVEWDCWGDGCGTDDPRPMLAVAGAFLSLLASAMLVTVVRLTGFGLVLALAPAALITGWQAAVADGMVTAESVSGQVGVWRIVGIAGAVIALLGLFIEFRAPGPSWRLFGWEAVPAELGDHHGGMASLAFTDRRGRRHVVRLAVPELLRGKPVRAYYLVSDPSRARVVPGKVVSTGDEDTPAQLSTELTRLAALHAEGHLTDAEFEQAKRRVLGS